MGYEQIRTEVEDGVVTLTLDRPDKLNAWTHQMAAELSDALRCGNDDPEVDAFVIAGAGRAFCSGADVKALFKTQADRGEVDRTNAAAGSWVDLLRESKPVVAAIHGICFGVGLSQLMPMDVLVAANDAKLSFRFIKMGLIPELGSSHFLVARAGFGHASRLMLSGATVDGEEARRIGLVDYAVPADELLPFARQTAREMGGNPSAAVRAVKRLLTENMAETDLALVQRRELEALTAAYKTPEHREAIDAFLEKREPDFRKLRGG
jgi:2-(1,2-epoxy-1,2-dihydrophenyl)acetyl-CoA isomerase